MDNSDFFVAPSRLEFVCCAFSVVYFFPVMAFAPGMIPTDYMGEKENLIYSEEKSSGD